MRHTLFVGDMEDGPRAMIRMGHIYILFSALLHVMTGLYMQLLPKGFARYLQITASLLLFLATALLYYSFFNELPTNHIERGLCRLGVYACLASVIGHCLAVSLDGRNL